MTDTHRPPLASVPRRLAMVMAGTLLATTIPFAGSAMAETEVITGDGLVPTVRFAGENRFDTAQLIATENTGFEAAFSGDAMIVATGDRFPDALAGSSLGGAEAAPIVLTPSTTAITPGELDEDLVEAIEGVDPETIYILGETEAVSAEIESLIDTGYDAAVTRIGGENRYETAALLARERADELAASAETRTAIVARADEFPDALVAGAIAAATSAGDDPAPIPILLTDTSGPVNPFTADALEDLDIQRVIIAGGEEAVSAEVATELGTIVGSEPDRVSGPNRYSTAAAFATLAEIEFDDAGFGFGTDHVNLATGQNFPDALALGPHAGLDVGGPAPILLTEGPILGEPATAYLESIGDCDYGAGVPGGAALHVAGGPVAVPDTVVEEAREALTAVGDACAIALTPETATNLVGETHTVTAAVVDNAGNPVDATLFDEPVTVSFTTAETGTAQVSPETATVEVAADGTATFDFTSNLPGDVTVTAEVTDLSGVVRTATATKTFALPAEPETLVGFSGTGPTTTLFVPDEPDTLEVTATAPVTGVPAGETIVGTDFRPYTRELFAISDAGTIYTITLGVAPNAVAVNSVPLPGDYTGGVAFDFNPVVDRIRVVTPGAAGVNLVVDPDTGTPVTAQPTVTYAAGDASEGLAAQVTAAAYVGGNFGETATATALFDIDSGTNALVRQSATGDTAGQLTTVGPLGVAVTSVNGFDVSGDTGIAYAALQTEGDADLGLYVVDLDSGATALVDDLPDGLTALAVAPRVATELGLLLQDDNTIIAVNVLAALDAAVPQPVAGVTAGTTLVGLDYRDSTGTVYALGDDGQLYVVLANASGAGYTATPIGEPLPLAAGTDLTAGVGFDVNPVVDRIRLVTADGSNYRINPESVTAGTGVVTSDGTLSYGPGETGTVTAAAYTGNVSGVTATELYDIDTQRDALVLQAPPNEGTLTEVGDLLPGGGDVTAANGFDISGVTGDAYAVLETGADDTGIYRVDLANGDVTLIGPAVSAAVATATDTVGFTIVPTFTDVLGAALEDENEVPPVDAGAAGVAALRINTASNVICSTLAVEKGPEDGTFAGSPGAHVHEAPVGENGPIVQPLPVPSDEADERNGRSGSCFPADALLDLDELVEDPAGYYVNVHTTEYPAGIVRGQLETVVDLAQALSLQP